MWQATDPLSATGQPVEFYFDEHDSSSASVSSEWICVWQCRPANPVTLVKFSSDSLLFATIGKVGLSIMLCDWSLHRQIVFVYANESSKNSVRLSASDVKVKTRGQKTQTLHLSVVN